MAVMRRRDPGMVRPNVSGGISRGWWKRALAASSGWSNRTGRRATRSSSTKEEDSLDLPVELFQAQPGVDLGEGDAIILHIIAREPLDARDLVGCAASTAMRLPQNTSW